MGDRTKIEWTDGTWNPVAGCRKISEGCRHCYAMTDAARIVARLRGLPSTQRRDATLAAYEAAVRMDGAGNPRPEWSGRATLRPEVLEQPLRWRKPRRIFVNSMSDLFHEDVPFRFIAAVFGVMSSSPQHTFQVLTKRPEQMLKFFGWLERRAAAAGLLFPPPDWTWPLPNVWLGVSVEDQQAADERVPLLLQCPAAVRWLSMEPLLGPVDLTRVDCPGLNIAPAFAFDVLRGGGSQTESPWSIDWVVVGGESGPDARPMHPQWVRGIRDQCADATVPFFFKQWGEWGLVGAAIPMDAFGKPGEMTRTSVAASTERRQVGTARWRCHSSSDNGDVTEILRREGKKRAGRQLDGRTHDDYPHTAGEVDR
jgi:protein gp37